MLILKGSTGYIWLNVCDPTLKWFSSHSEIFGRMRLMHQRLEWRNICKLRLNLNNGPQPMKWHAENILSALPLFALSFECCWCLCALLNHIFCLRSDYHSKINAIEYSKTTDNTQRMSFNTIDISSWIKCKQNNNRIATFIRSASVRHSRHFFRQLFLHTIPLFGRCASLLQLFDCISVHFPNISSSIEEMFHCVYVEEGQHSNGIEAVNVYMPFARSIFFSLAFRINLSRHEWIDAIV